MKSTDIFVDRHFDNPKYWAVYYVYKGETKVLTTFLFKPKAERYARHIQNQIIATKLRINLKPDPEFMSLEEEMDLED